MRILWTILALAAPLAAQQGFDFKTLDKLGEKARDTTNVTLEGPALKLAASFLGDDKNADSLRSLVANLKAIYVRSWEFEREGAYTNADIEPFRAWLRTPQWSKIVDVKEPHESAEVFLRRGQSDRLGGLAVIDAEPLELTILYIDGPISMADIGKLSGSLDIPDLDVLKHGTSNEGKSNANGKKDE